MTERFDPYEELGVPRDAADEAVKAGYRRRAKETHPDAGGTEEAFQATKLALTVLSDPAKRERFDRTGKVEDDEPDNVRANALGILSKYLGEALDPFLTGKTERDPRWSDMVADIRAKLEHDRMEQDPVVVAGEEVVAFLRDIAGRFEAATDDNVLRRATERSARKNEEQLDVARGRLADIVMALKMLDGAKFRRDVAPKPEPKPDRFARPEPMKPHMIKPYIWGEPFP